MPETDRSRALGGLVAAAVGTGIGLALILLAWGVMALFGDGEFPSGLEGLAILPVGGQLRLLWDRRPVNRRPAALVALLLLLLVAMLATALGDLYAEETGIGQLLFGYVPGVLLSGAAFGALCGDFADEPGRHWLRFTGRGGRFHLAVYGCLFALLALTAAAIGAAG